MLAPAFRGRVKAEALGAMTRAAIDLFRSREVMVNAPFFLCFIFYQNNSVSSRGFWEKVSAEKNLAAFRSLAPSDEGAVSRRLTEGEIFAGQIN